MRQAKARGLAPKLIAFSGGPSVREFGDLIGDAAEGVISSAQWAPGIRMPGSFDFSFRFKQKYGHHASYPAAEGYAALLGDVGRGHDPPGTQSALKRLGWA